MNILTNTLPHPFSEYIVYSDGRVFSDKSQRFLSQRLINSGYLRVRLWSENKEYSWLVHRLVAICFVPNPNQYTVVNHIDGNRLNNNYWNLEWTTQEKNLFAAQCMGLSPDREVHPYEITDGTRYFLFQNFKQALKFLDVNPGRYCYNEILRNQLKYADEFTWFPIAHTEWAICIRRDLLLNEFEWA